MRRLLRHCLDSVRDQLASAEVVVVDNLGDPRVRQLAATLRVRYVDPGSNVGYARGVRIGVAAGGAGAWTSLLILNPDVVLADISPLLHAVPAAPAVTACLRRQDGTMEGNARPLANPWRELARAFVGGLLYESRPPDLDGRTERIGQGAGSLLLVRRSAWEDLRGFDERFELYYEDVDLCRRLRTRGGVARVRTVVGVHVGGSSYRRNRHEAHVAMCVSRHRYLRKWYGPAGVVVSMVTVAIETISRAIVPSNEGWRTRMGALTSVLREVITPGSVSVLSRALRTRGGDRGNGDRVHHDAAVGPGAEDQQARD